MRASESRGDRQGVPVEGEADGLEDGKASPSGGLQHGPDIGIERGPPRRAEAVGDLAEDNAGPERLLGAVVGGRDGAVGDEDEEVLAEALDDALELQPGLGGRDDPEEIVEPGLEAGMVDGERGVGQVGAAAADADGALLECLQAGCERVIAAVDGVLNVAQQMGEAGLMVLSGPSHLRAETIGHPEIGPHRAEKLLDHCLAA